MTASGSSRTAPSPPRTAGSPLPARRRTCPPAGMRASESTARAAGSRPGSSTATPISSIGGDRAHEFELRLEGASYEEIARAGGGIVSTVKATRAASEDELVASALPRLDHLIAEGCTTVEIKSGYGLDLDTEARMLRAARRLGERASRIRRHHLPRRPCPAAGGERRQGRLSSTRSAREMLPALAREGLADAVDAFCEGIAFSPEQTARVFDAAQGAWPAGQAPRRPALEPARREARRRLRRALGRSSRIHGRGRRRRDGEGRHGRRAAAGRLLHPARDEAAAGRGVPPSTACTWRSRPTAIPAPRR